MGVARLVRGQAAGIGVGLLFGLLLFAGGVLVTLWATEGEASHAGDGMVHACVSAYTGQARVMLPGRPPACNSSERLVEWPGAALGADVGALAARVAALETENAAYETRIEELETENDQQQTAIETQQTASTTQAGLITELQGDVAEHASRLTALEYASVGVIDSFNRLALDLTDLRVIVDALQGDVYNLMHPTY